MFTNTTVNPGIATKVGVGIEPGPGQAVKIARLFELVSFNMKGGPKRLRSRAIRNHPGTPRTVLGPGSYAGTLVAEVTPESLSEVWCLTNGAPSTAAVSAPAAPSAPAISQVGAAGAATATYSIIACNAQGDSAASATATTNTGNAVLSATNYNLVTIVPVAGATFYKILKGAALLGSTQTLTFADTGMGTSVYAAPSAPTGNQHAWNTGLNSLTGTIAVQYASNLIRIYAGCRGNKLNFKYDTNASDPFTVSADLTALYEVDGFTAAAVGLDVAGFDPLPGYGMPPQCIAQIGGAVASVSTWEATVDRNLGDKRILNGSAGAVSNFLKGGQHKVTATLYFDSDTEHQRFFGVANQAGVYSHTNTVLHFPVMVTVSNPVNGGGVINSFVFYFPYATYDTVGESIEGKDGAIMQQVEIYPDIDPVTGYDVVMYEVNSRSNANIITPGTLITGFNGGVMNVYSN